MAINFPSSPNDGDIYSAVGRTWQYNATAGAWESLAESNVSLSTLGLVNHELININSSAEFGNALIPDTDITYDLGSTTKKWRDLYLSGSSIQLGTKTITQDNIPEVDLAIAPEVLEIQVAAPDAGQDTAWLWTWEQSTLPYARRTITNSPEVSVPIYKQGSYVVNNFAAYDLIGSMTQTHTLYFKWIDGAGTDNLISWATSTGPFSDSHPDINSGTAVDVQRITLSVPATVTPPTLTAPSVSYTVTNNGAGAYTFSGSASGDNPNIGPFYRGGTYTFNVSASGHPFYLTTDNGTNFSAGTYFGEYTDGVTGSRSDSGAVTITVPNDAPNTLYYQCGNHSAMRGAITVKDLAVEVNNNGNYVIYAQHTQEGHKTPVEIRPIPSLVNQMCLVYDASVGKFVPQDLATYVENTPSFENKIREVAGTAELVVEDGSTVIAKVNVYDDSTYLPLVGNNPGDQAFATDTNILYIWDGTAWQQAGTTNSDDLTEGSTNLFYTDARVSSYLTANDYDTATNIVASIVDTAPTTLDTLNELAAALGDDPNFATTVTNSIATKLAIADFDSTFDTRLATKTTTDLTEGTNLYYTDARADARIAAATTDDLTEGSTNLYHTTARVQGTTINAGSLRGTVNNATVQYGTSYSGTPAQGSFFFDSLNQKLKVYTGSAFVDAVPSGSGGGGGGGETAANATFRKYTYSITSSTNAVSGADDNTETLSYVTDGTQNVEVYVNGVKQVEGASNDYVASTGTSVTFVDNLSSGDVVDIQVYELLTNDAYYLKSETYTQTETNSQISTALAGLVDSAPTTLDTLNELAAALGDDPNFATTVTNSIADKLPLAGGTLTGNLTINASLQVNGALGALKTTSTVEPGIRFENTNANGLIWDIFSGGGGASQYDNWLTLYRRDTDPGSDHGVFVQHGNLWVNNNIGIGTSSPTAKLDVVETTRDVANIRVNGKAFADRAGIVNYFRNGDFKDTFLYPRDDNNTFVSIDTSEQRISGYNSLKFDCTSATGQYHDILNFGQDFALRDNNHIYSMVYWAKNTTGGNIQVGTPGGGGEMLQTIPGDSTWRRYVVTTIGGRSTGTLLENRTNMSGYTGALYFSEFMIFNGDAESVTDNYIPSIYDVAPGLDNGRDGLTPETAAYSGKDLINNGQTTSGDYWIKPKGYNGSAIQCYVDMTTDGGGWVLCGVFYNEVGFSMSGNTSGKDESNVKNYPTSFPPNTKILNRDFVNKLMYQNGDGAVTDYSYLSLCGRANGGYILANIQISSANRNSSFDYFKAVYQTQDLNSNADIKYYSVSSPNSATDYVGKQITGSYATYNDGRTNWASGGYHYIPDDVSGGGEWLFRENYHDIPGTAYGGSSNVPSLYFIR